MKRTVKDNNSIHYTKAQAEVELFRKAVLSTEKALIMKEVGVKEKEIDYIDGKRKVLSYAYDEAKEIDSRIVEKLSKTMFSFANAYPYLFDAVCGLLSNQKELCQKYKKEVVSLADIPEALFLMVDIPFDEFLNWALDGEKTQKNSLIRDLINLAAAPAKETKKYIPISKNYCARIAPIEIILLRKNEEAVSMSKLKSLRNLTIRKINKGTSNEKVMHLPERLPIGRIQILPLKILFQDLLIGEHGEKWFEVPKAFQAKIVSFRSKYIEELSINLGGLSKELKSLQEDERKDNNEIEAKNKEYEELKMKIESFPSPMVLRRTYLYLKLHSSSNKKARKINITPSDFFAHVDPSYLKKNKHKDIYYVLGGVRGCLNFLETVNNFFIAFGNKYNFGGNDLNILHPNLLGTTSQLARNNIPTC
jgi:predicted  nucleic acid-binding Zn-ribbon protein